MRYVTSAGRRRRGAMIVQIALCLTALFGIMAVALDGGMMLTERRHAQATADAAALAGASDLFKNFLSAGGVDGGTAATSAKTSATANGYTAANSTVTVNIPPKSGTFKGQAGYVEVIVTYNQARFFSAMWGSSTIPVSARAVARGLWQPSSPAILTLKPKGSGTLSTNGNGDIQASRAPGTTSGGNIVVDSNDPSGITLSGKNAQVDDPDGIMVSGSPGYSGSGSIIGAVSPNQPPTPDPLRFLPEPSVPATAAAKTSAGGVDTYYPGYYPSGLTVSGGYTAVFSPGLYYFNGALVINGNPSSSLTGSGVMLFIGPSGSLSMQGNGAVALSPETSSIYAGVLIFQSRSNANNAKIAGNGALTSLSGTIYTADATLTLTGNGGNIGSQIIANQVSAGGNGSINVTYNSSTVAKTRILNLVE